MDEPKYMEKVMIIEDVFNFEDCITVTGNLLVDNVNYRELLYINGKQYEAYLNLNNSDTVALSFYNLETVSPGDIIYRYKEWMEWIN